MPMPAAAAAAGTRPSTTRSRSQSPQRRFSSPRAQDCAATTIKRSVSSCLELGSRHRVRIQYDNDEFRARSEANLRRLFVEATDPANASTNAKLPKKALAYRQLLHRVDNVDALDPGFDASKVLGVTWVKSHVE